MADAVLIEMAVAHRSEIQVVYHSSLCKQHKILDCCNVLATHRQY